MMLFYGVFVSQLGNELLVRQNRLCLQFATCHRVGDQGWKARGLKEKDLMSPLLQGRRHRGLARGRITALRSWVLSVAGDILSWIRCPSWRLGSGGLWCWDLGAGALWHSAVGHSRGVTQGEWAAAGQGPCALPAPQPS